MVLWSIGFVPDFLRAGFLSLLFINLQSFEEEAKNAVSFFPELIGPETLCWTPSYKDQLSVSQIYLKLDSGIDMVHIIPQELVRNAESQASTPELLKQSLKFNKSLKRFVCTSKSEKQG